MSAEPAPPSSIGAPATATANPADGHHRGQADPEGLTGPGGVQDGLGADVGQRPAQPRRKPVSPISGPYKPQASTADTASRLAPPNLRMVGVDRDRLPGWQLAGQGSERATATEGAKKTTRREAG